VSKEIEVKIVKDSFQGMISNLQKEDIGQSQRLSIPEQLRGDVMLKVWETKLREYKEVTEEVIKDCQKIFDSIEEDSLQNETNGLPKSLEEINIDCHQQLKIREEFEERRTEISNVKAVNMSEIEKWMIGPSSKLERIKSTEKGNCKSIARITKKLFLFRSKRGARSS
jgi:hypothetical protein